MVGVKKGKRGESRGVECTIVRSRNKLYLQRGLDLRVITRALSLSLFFRALLFCSLSQLLGATAVTKLWTEAENATARQPCQ